MEYAICLDTDILIDFLRNKKETVKWIEENEKNKILVTTIINLFELYLGAYKNSSPEKIDAVNELKERLKIIDFDEKSAENVGRICSMLDKKGIGIDKRDLFIGVIALTKDFSIKTNNKKHFSRIEGLRIIE